MRDVTFDVVDRFLRDPTSPHLGEVRLGMSDQNIADIVAYLNSLPEGGCTQIQLVEAIPPEKKADFSLVSTHNPSSEDYDSNCTTCHGDRLNESATDSTTLAAHSVMRGLLGSGNHRCLNCHVDSGDLVAHESSRLRENIFQGVASCASALCHGASGPLPFYVADK